MRIGLLLSGCGVYDGAEIQEAVLAMLAIADSGAELLAIGVDKPQHHVINHLTGEELPETRNMLVEAARIARGNVREISTIDPSMIDALVVPGGFGSAKNFTDWAFNGPAGDILPEVKLLIVNMVNAGKPIAALCVSPVVIAKALEGSSIRATMTIGTDREPSPYDIGGFAGGLEATGAISSMKTVREIHIDSENKIITAPCYMMEAGISEVNKNIRTAIEELVKLVG